MEKNKFYALGRHEVELLTQWLMREVKEKERAEARQRRENKRVYDLLEFEQKESEGFCMERSDQKGDDT